MNRSAASSMDPAKRNEQTLLNLLKIESNKYCADCGQKGTRWASWNIGVFLCIRCGGLHRALGTHISKVKSVTLDKWTDEQVESIKSKGNAIVNQLYNPHPERHPFPAFSGDAENYIRDKYERKLFMDDSSSSSPQQSGTRMVLKKKSSVMDDDDLPEFKVSTPELTNNTQYAKQLTLLAEMGFTDTEFNLKTLQAANGNMQDALEIIVAANQRLRKKKSISSSASDELNETDLFSSAVGSTTTKKPQPIVDLMDSLDLGHGQEISRKSSTSHSGNAGNTGNTGNIVYTTNATTNQQFFIDDSNPWSQLDAPTAVKSSSKSNDSIDPIDPVIETGIEPIPSIEPITAVDSSPSDLPENSMDDPLAFNPFKSTTSNQFSDDLFANPW